MKTIVSGIRSTGNLHLGNYYGALRNFISMQNDSNNNCFFFIADLHALTTHPQPEILHPNVKNVLTDFLAAGLDPEKSAIFVQSDVPEVVELYLLLNMHAYLGELEKTVSFKDKARKQPNNVNAALLTYPTLMAADIMIHNADEVPVGKDQEQHLEMTRNFAQRFNHFYKTEYFKLPKAYSSTGELIKIPGLDGSGKMGKSEGNCIYLSDDEKTISKKVMKALTDEGPKEMNSVKPDYIENLFTFLRIVSTPDTLEYFEEKWNKCEIRYGDLKKQIAADIVKATAPIRERRAEIEANPKILHDAVTRGAELARASAQKTLKDVKEIMGFKPF